MIEEITIVIAVIGGDARKFKPDPKGVRIIRFSSHKNGGGKNLKKARKKISNGNVDQVFFISKWLGHSMFKTIKKSCKSLDIKFEIIRGGESQVRRKIEDILKGSY